MEQICEFSVTNKLGQKECTVDDIHQPCIHQKYCRKTYAWVFTDLANCDRREKEMSKKHNDNFNLKIASKNNEDVRELDLEDKNIEKEESNVMEIEVNNQVEKIKEKEEKIEIHGKVICVGDNYVIVADEDGKGHTLVGITAKFGDVI